MSGKNEQVVSDEGQPEEPLTIPGKDGDDAPLYLEKTIQRVLQKLELGNEEGKA